jgi:serine/threonine protein kinase
MIGTILQDRYQIERRIGRGGFAQVYRGFDTKLKRPVAVKVLDEAGDMARVKTRFLREAESMAKCNHPNIAAVYDYAEHNNQPYMVMEYIDGPTLLDLVEKSPLTPRQTCAIALQVCRGMSYAHKNGVIHRDLTLRNVMVVQGADEIPLVKILDFGLAKILHEQAETTGKSMVGTPYYMAPEQIKDETIDGRVDIFAFGVGLHRLINGRFPFHAEHPTALMYLILNESDVSFADAVPDGMRRIILRCLEKDRDARASSFDELIPLIEEMERQYRGLVDGGQTSVIETRGLARRTSKRNPYLNRAMIKRPAEFFGRTKEVRKIYSRLDAPDPQSISVVGDRRIGKSSLLNYIYHPKNRKQHMQNNDNAVFAYLDFQSDAAFDVPKFIDFLFNMFTLECKGTHDFAGRARTLDELRAVVQELHDAGKRIVILMDEFESITRNPKFEKQFFSFLRSLGNNYKVAYVTSSSEDLQQMCYDKDIADSPFFNIFGKLPLRPFTREEAVELVTAPSKAEGVPLEAYADEIIGLAGLFPLYLQIGCSTVFEYLVENEGAGPNWDEIRRGFMDEVEQHYRFVWERMDEAARGNLARVAAGKPVSKEYGFVNEELERRGYLVQSGKGLGLFSSSFKDFVLHETENTGKKRGFLGAIFGRKG